MLFYMIVDANLYQTLVIRELKHEARISDRQVRKVEWDDFNRDGYLKIWRNREVKLSAELYNAIASLPVRGRKVFKIENDSSLPLEKMPDAPERQSIKPVIADEKELLAKLIAEKLLK